MSVLEKSTLVISLGFWNTVFLAFLSILIFYFAFIIYNIYFHSLSHIPGPRLWAASSFPYAYNLLRGRLHLRLKNLHDLYGDAIRISPNEVSFTKNSAWTDIYTGGVSNKGFPKQSAVHNVQGFVSLFDAPDDCHSRMRKALSKGYFSSAAINSQESDIQRYTKILVQRLRDQIDKDENNSAQGRLGKGGTVNVQRWYNFLGFDLAGQLTLGEDFGCLAEQSYHPWISMILAHIQMASVVFLLRLYAPLDKILIALAPRQLWDLKDRFLNVIQEKVKRRMLVLHTEDTYHYLAAGSTKLGSWMSTEEIEANCMLFIVASSETSVTTLLGATYQLCKNPDVMKRLCDELRSLGSPDMLTEKTLSKIEYLDAVLKETLRLCPPIAHGPARVVNADGVSIAGYQIPFGKRVGVTQYAANLSSQNFTNPESFMPERWLNRDPAAPCSNDSLETVRPFSAGNRDCIGKAMAMVMLRITLAHLIYTFDFILADDSFIFSEQKVYFLWHKDPLWVNLRLAKHGDRGS